MLVDMSLDVQKYRMTFKCSCGNVYKKITKNPDLKSAPCPECKKKDKITKFVRLGDGPVPSSEAKIGIVPPRPAPNVIYKCKACNSITRIFEEVGEPGLSECPACDSKEIQYRGHISKDIPTESTMRNKAVDMTADIVMQDYKLGDIKDNVRVGETMAPKLEPRLQASADNMFGGAKKRGASFNAANVAKRAMSGSLRDPKNYVDPVARLQPAYKPNISIVAGDGVKG